MKRAWAITLFLAPVGLLTWGAFLAWPPAGPLTLGLLLWIDLYLGDRLRGSGS